MEQTDVEYDEDGRVKRTGTFWTASAGITTALVGSGVLSLASAFAQLGWIMGPTVLCFFSTLTLYTSYLLAACYRHPVSKMRRYSFFEVVQANLGLLNAIICETIRNINRFAIVVEYILAAGTSMVAIQRFRCKNTCDNSHNAYMIAFAASEIILSQLPRFNEVSSIAICAAFMSFTYSFIAIGLGIAKVSETDKFRGSLSGIQNMPLAGSQKLWRSFQGVGAIAFAFFFSPFILIEIQDTLKSTPSEFKTMKKATNISIGVTTFFYMLCACFGYASFGELAPENLLSESGYGNPFWLTDIANGAIIIQVIAAYQFDCRPIFVLVEKHAAQYFPDSNFINQEHHIPLLGGFIDLKLNIFRLIWRTVFVILTKIVAMLMPSVNDFVGLIKVIGFWTLTIYFPVKVYMIQKEIPKWSIKWMALQTLIIVGFFVSGVVVAVSLARIVN